MSDDLTKYAVEEEEPSSDGAKNAAQANTCPRCGGPLLPSKLVNVKICKECGTLPWER